MTTTLQQLVEQWRALADTPNNGIADAYNGGQKWAYAVAAAELAAALAASGEAVLWVNPEQLANPLHVGIGGGKEGHELTGKHYTLPLYAAPQPAHSNSSASVELSMKEVLVPCDCGCDRKCCANCGVDLGFISEATQPAPLPCTCPSGDGSLRWPCPRHPPEAAPQPESDGSQIDWRELFRNERLNRAMLRNPKLPIADAKRVADGDVEWQEERALIAARGAGG